MSLADELLADLEETENEDLAEQIKDELMSADEDVGEAEHDGIQDDDFDNVVEIDVRVSSIRELCKLRDSKQLTNILREIDAYVANPRKSNEMIGNVESDPEYQLIVEANGIAVDIDNEICKLLFIFLKKTFKIVFFF